MFDEKAYREHLEKFTKDKIIDLYIQKCFDEHMTKLYGEGGCEFEDKSENGQFATSGYLEELNPDGTRKYPIPKGEIKTTVYCSGCEEKDKIIADLENKIDKLLELFEGITEKIVDVCEECKEVGDYGN